MKKDNNNNHRIAKSITRFFYIIIIIFFALNYNIRQLIAVSAVAILITPVSEWAIDWLNDRYV